MGMGRASGDLLYQVSAGEHMHPCCCFFHRARAVSLAGAKRWCHTDPECLAKCLMWHEWEAIRGQAGGAGGSARLALLGTVRWTGGRAKAVNSLDALRVWSSAWEHRAEMLKRFRYYEAISASAACRICDGEQGKEASVCVCVRQMSTAT